MFNNRVCGCETIKIINPDDKTLKYVKELVLIGKEIISEMKADVVNNIEMSEMKILNNAKTSLK